MADLTAMMQAAAGAAGDEATFIEDVFSTYLYTGTGAALTITNGIDLSGKGGLVWAKCRSVGNHSRLFDTSRGVGNALFSSLSSAQSFSADTLTAFSSTGFTLGSDDNINGSGATNVAWTFREQAKFFDVVTYTGTGSARTVAHNLGSVPGMIIVKRTDTTGDWQVYHRANTANPETDYLVLNTNAATADSDTRWNDTLPTSTVFSLGTDATVNASGGNYVAYLFAHDAGGFGTAGTDNVISCGSFTTDGSGNATVSLGYEPQYLMFKISSTTGNWFVLDNMREWSLTNQNILRPNLSDAEFSASWGNPTATGFTFDKGNLAASATFIYMAIRRPMKVPTTGTSVFSPNLYTEIVANPTILTSGFATDLNFQARNAASPSGFYWTDKLRGSTASANNLFTSASTAAEATFGVVPSSFDNNTGIVIKEVFNNTPGATDISYQFRRASGFMDIVCYTGTGSATTQAHNLGVVPELMIFKDRSGTNGWVVYASALTATSGMVLNNANAAFAASSLFNDTAPTATQFTVNTAGNVNSSGANYVAYLFATCAGVSKVGSYTGTGATQTINCGFTGGARFVLIKRTDSTGDWWVWDTARGMVSGTDPRLALNSSAAESNNDWVYTVTNGFQIVTSDATVNASGGSYIYLAIA
jgi:hypothetical protein